MIHVSNLKFAPSSFGGAAEPLQQLAMASDFSDQNLQIQHGVWESGPGELNLHFDWSETVFVLDGAAEILNIDSGEKFELVVGSMATFQKGTRWQWRIPWKLKKVFTIIDRSTIDTSLVESVSHS